MSDSSHFHLFLVFLWIWIGTIIFTGLNSVVFTCYFLPFVYSEDYSFWEIVRWNMITQYWDWFFGRIMVLLNLALFLASAVLWTILRRDRK